MTSQSLPPRLVHAILKRLPVPQCTSAVEEEVDKLLVSAGYKPVTTHEYRVARKGHGGCLVHIPCVAGAEYAKAKVYTKDGATIIVYILSAIPPHREHLICRDGGDNK